MEVPLARKISDLQNSIQSIAQRAHRDPKAMGLILVTKTVSCERIEEAFQAGIRDFGENKMQELLEKQPKLSSEIQWHFIGHLQTNKVKFLLEDARLGGKLPLLHSLDRRELAEAIEKEARKRGLAKVPCLIQVNSSGETTKGGFKPEDVEKFVRELSPNSVLDIQGLMTLGPLTEDAAKTRQAFRSVAELQQNLKQSFPEKKWDILSMGMSSDYPIAIEEGSTLLRIGSAVFGPRSLK